MLEQTPIERDQVAADPLTRELQLDQFAAGPAKLAPQLRIECEVIDGVGERVGIVERNQQRVEAVTRDIATSGDVGRDQRAAASRSLQQAQGQSLPRSRGA